MQSAVVDPEAWDLTVIRAQGLRLMRPEKSWRPIVTVEVDKQSRHEAVLGVDGQNPNLKQYFRFYDVTLASKVEMQVWHRSQSKKKSKKRNLVASATHSLSDLLKRADGEKGVLGKRSKCNVLDIRLHCQSCSSSSSKKATPSSKGHPQGGALLTIKLTPPRSSPKSPSPLHPDPASISYHQDESMSTGQSTSGYTTDASASSLASSTHTLDETRPLIDVQPPSPTSSSHPSSPSPVDSEDVLPTPPGLPPLINTTTPTNTLRRRNRKRMKGYLSEEFSYSEEESSDCASVSACSGSGSSSFFGGRTPTMAPKSISRSPSDDSACTTAVPMMDDDDELLFLPAVRTPSLSSPSQDEKDLKGVGLDVPLPPKTISLVTSESCTKTTKTLATTTTVKKSMTSWIAASLLPQHMLTYATTTTPNSNSISLSSSRSAERPASPSPSSSSCDAPVPPYTETDITAVDVEAGGSKKKASTSKHGPSVNKNAKGKGKQVDEEEEEEEEESQKSKWWEVFLGNFTLYLDLRDARTDSDFEAVLQQLRMEWTFMGGFLAALGAVDVAIFAISPDSIISLPRVSLSSIALSSIYTGLGIASLAYFILRYSFSPPALFRMRAMDLYGSYVFFSLSARVPTLCMVASACFLLVFLGLVAFEVFPVGVVIGCFGVGLLMSLQFLVYGCHMFIRGVIGGVRRVVGAARRGVFKAAGSATPAPAVGANGASLRTVKPGKWKTSRKAAGTPVGQ